MLLLESLHRHKNMPNDRNEYFYMNVRKITLCCQELLASDNRQSVNNVVSRLMIWLMYCVLAPFIRLANKLTPTLFIARLSNFLSRKSKVTPEKRGFCVTFIAMPKMQQAYTNSLLFNILSSNLEFINQIRKADRGVLYFGHNKESVIFVF